MKRIIFCQSQRRDYFYTLFILLLSIILVIPQSTGREYTSSPDNDSEIGCDVTFIEPFLQVTNETCAGASDGTIMVFATSSNIIEYIVYPAAAPSDAIFQTSPLFTDLPPGDYNVEVRDLEFPTCTGGLIFTTILPGPGIDVQILGEPFICFDGTGELSVEAGFATYEWSNGSTGQSTIVVFGGPISVTVTNVEGCTGVDQAFVEVNAEILANGASIDPSAPGINDGAITLNPSGGVAPYTYLWGDLSNGQSLSNLGPGEYTVLITDNVGCTLLETFTLAGPQYLSRAEAIEILINDVIVANPPQDSLAGFLMNNTGPDSIFFSGTNVEPWDSAWEETIEAPTYLFFLDLEQHFEWLHASSFVFMNAIDGSYWIKDAESWPIINGTEFSDFLFEGTDSPDLVTGDYGNAMAPLITTETVETANDDDWAIIVVGKNLTGPCERRARENDVERIKECLNKVTLGPQITKENIITVPGDEFNGATPEEVCAAIDGLMGKACKKIYFHYVGHGGSKHMVLKKEDSDRKFKFKYEKLACKLLDLGVPEVCITIEACKSGSAIDPMRKKSITKNDKEVKLKGTIITSSSKSKCTLREKDGTPFIKSMLQCCKDLDADLDMDGKVTMLEAITWAKFLDPKVKFSDPQALILEDDKKIKFGCDTDNIIKSYKDCGGQLFFFTKTYSYTIKKGSSEGKDSTVSRSFVYVQNPKPKDVHRGQKKVKVQCKKADKMWHDIVPAFTPSLGVGKPRIKVNSDMKLEMIDPILGERICIGDFPSDCTKMRIVAGENRIGKDKVNEEISLVDDLELPKKIAIYTRGEYVFLKYNLIDSADQVYQNEIIEFPDWGLTIDPQNFTTHELFDTASIIIRGFMPEAASGGSRILMASHNLSNPDTTIFQTDALLYDSLTTAMIDGSTFDYSFINNPFPIESNFDRIALVNSQNMFVEDASVEISPTGVLLMEGSNIYADSSSIFSFESSGILSMDNSSIVSPESGLNIIAGDAVIFEGSVLFSRGNGMILGNAVNVADVHRLFIAESNLSGLVIDGNNRDLHEVRIFNSGEYDIEVENSGHVRMIDSYFDMDNISVGDNSVLERLWSTTFEVMTMNGEPLPDYPFVIRDIDGNIVAMDTTNTEAFSKLQYLREKVVMGSNTTDYKTHSITFNINNKDTTLFVDITQPAIITLTVPDIIIDTQDPGADLFGIHVFPNPASNLVRIDLDSPLKGIGELFIIDEVGRKISQDVFNISSRHTELILDVSSVLSGNYWIVWRQNQKEKSVPLKVIR